VAQARSRDPLTAIRTGLLRFARKDEFATRAFRLVLIHLRSSAEANRDDYGNFMFLQGDFTSP
jgi:hypothetical protein